MDNTVKTKWTYYIKEDGESKDDAQYITIYYWQHINDHEDAASFAAEDEWDNRDGWERGVGDGPVITVISPDGKEASFNTYREASIDHTVTVTD